MLDSDAEVPQDILAEYEKLLKKSYTENFDELYRTDLLKIIGKDGYGSHIVLLIPCFIVSTGVDPEKTLRYAILRLDPIVKENYILILCETHTSWLTDAVYAYAKQWYDTLPRKYKKNLKKLYLLHSGFLSKTVLTILTPFVSAKFWKKVEYIEKLEDLFLKLNIKPTHYLRHFPYIVQRNEEIMLGEKPISFFGADLEILCQRFGKPYMEFKHIPSIIVDFLSHLSKPEIINTKDLFYLQADANTLYGIIGDIDYGEPTTDFNNIPALVCSFKLFLDTQKHGLLGKDAFSRLHHLKSTSSSNKVIRATLSKLYEKLEPGVQQCVLCILKFFQKVSSHSNENNMTSETLSKIFSSTFFRGRKPNATFAECIPLANKCMGMLIEKPDILVNSENFDSESKESERSDSSSDDNSESSKDENSKASSSNESGSSSDESKEEKGKSSSSGEESKQNSDKNSEDSSKSIEKESTENKNSLEKSNSKKEDSEENSEEESEEDSEEESEDSEEGSKKDNLKKGDSNE